MKTETWQSPKRKRASVTKASKKLNSTPAREPSLSHTGSLSSMDNSQEYADPKLVKWPMDAPQTAPAQHRQRLETPTTQVTKFGGLQSPVPNTAFGNRLSFADTPRSGCETPRQQRHTRDTAEPSTSREESKDRSDNTHDLAKRFPPSPPSHLSFASFPASLPRVHSPASGRADDGCATPLSSISANESPSSFYIHTESPHFMQSPPSPVLGARTPSTHSRNSELETPIEEDEQEGFRMRGAARLSFTPVAQMDGAFASDEEDEGTHGASGGHFRRGAGGKEDEDEDEDAAKATDSDPRMLSGSTVDSPIHTPWRNRSGEDSSRERRTANDTSAANLSTDSLNTSGGANRSAFRPLPDQSAFDVSRRPKSNTTAHRSLAPPTPVCPPTPQRTPAWLHESVTAPVLARHNSLVATKVLISSGPDTGSVTFSEQFENMGTLGTGVFSDVYKVRSKVRSPHSRSLLSLPLLKSVS